MIIKKEVSSENHLPILRALNEIPFSVGKTLLVDFLKGEKRNKSIIKHNLSSLYNFSSLSHLSEGEIRGLVDNLITNNLIESSTIPNSFIKIITITNKGSNELLNPTLGDKKLKNRIDINLSKITEEEKILFKELDFILSNFNDSQKKAIISPKEKIVCIAGAGSGKTTVLTKRIEFLIKYRGVSPDKILAITFTRKAKQEMESRLLDLGIKANVETFNSFSEGILRRYGSKIYNRQTRVMKYSDKIFALSMALAKVGLDIHGAVDRYFSENQKKGKEKDKLSNTFLNDCYSIIEYFKARRKEFYDFSKEIDIDKQNARIIYQVCLDIMQHMNFQGLRDFTDQLIDTLDFFKKYPLDIPSYEHILVDEYQDVNDAQIELLDLLSPKNLFAVGDPRQSIFGWRGSNINYILDFQKKFSNSEAIGLNENYRSSKKILDLMNCSISSLGLENLENKVDREGDIRLLEFDSENEEYEFVIKKIRESDIDRNEIFVLARTNRQLVELSARLNFFKIPHVLKTDEQTRTIEPRFGEVVLSTIHSIKGLEAKLVFVIGSTEQNFPCKTSDHPILEFIKGQESDREEEERRLFYVAISRAKDNLFLTYSGKRPTHFITDEMRKIINSNKFQDIFK